MGCCGRVGISYCCLRRRALDEVSDSKIFLDLLNGERCDRMAVDI